MNLSHKVPFMRIARRDSISISHGLLIRLAGLGLALAVSAIVIYAIVKLNPLNVYGAMFEGSFGTEKRLWVTLRDTMMLLCIGIGLAPAFKMRFWNIGAEGQVLIGGIATAAVMIYCGNANADMAAAVDILCRKLCGRRYVGFYTRCIQGALRNE